MSKKKKIFYVFSCNEWKSFDSMRLELLTTSVRRLKSFITHKIERGDYEYDDAEMAQSQQAKGFREDFGKLDRGEVNGRLRFGFFDYLYDGEEF